MKENLFYIKYCISLIYAIFRKSWKSLENLKNGLIIRGSQDHALVGPLKNQALTKVYFVGAF